MAGDLDFDVTLGGGFRLHVRYDKERTFDLGDIVEKDRQASSGLLPYLLDLDWVVGSLD